MEYTIVSMSEIRAEPGAPLSAAYWIAKRQLEAEDARGAPYVVPYREPAVDEGNGYTRPGARIELSHELALAIARSKHPSRVLANTNGYRYGKFTENRFTGVVDVHMMGSHIAQFTPGGVRLWWRGYVTPSSTEALNSLSPQGYFYTSEGTVHYRTYAGGRASDAPAEEGRLYPYTERTQA